MIRLLSLLFFGHYCAHEWETDEIVDVYNDKSNVEQRLRQGRNAYMTCKKCGNWKKKRL